MRIKRTDVGKAAIMAWTDSNPEAVLIIDLERIFIPRTKEILDVDSPSQILSIGKHVKIPMKIPEKQKKFRLSE